MRPDTFLNAVGMIDDRHLDITVPKRQITRRRWAKKLLPAVIAATLVVFPLPVLTASGSEPAYNVLYHIAPTIAQTFKPVCKSCTDNGVEMTVISAEQNASEVSVYLAMQDISGTCPFGDWDLYDSYHINVPRDMTGHCSFMEYDEDTHTAYFVVHLETTDGSTMPHGKVTFSVREMIRGKGRTNGEIMGIDMGNIPYEPPTVTRTEQRGASGTEPDSLNIAEYRLLAPSEQPVCTPAPGVIVENIGYIGGALHILTRYQDIHHTDNHGFIRLTDKAGNPVADDFSVIELSYWDDARTDSYSEEIIPVSYEKLAECTLYGEFMTAQDYISGNWQVTFPLE